jgi:hypothetical protein
VEGKKGKVKKEKIGHEMGRGKEEAVGEREGKEI